jgi:CheY-like chemotaxis protein
MKKILLVDDNEMNNLLTSVYLKNALNEVEIEFAKNGVEAVKNCSLKNYDLIFMDVQMPLMDGIDATRNIRSKDGLNRCTHICFLTANNDDKTKKSCFEAGGNYFLTKPIVTINIKEVLRKFNLI